jgi:hypothetical protein
MQDIEEFEYRGHQVSASGRALVKPEEVTWIFTIDGDEYPISDRLGPDHVIARLKELVDSLEGKNQ